MREPLFQYQDLFEPVNFGAAPETVTLDKWIGVTPEPARRRRGPDKPSYFGVEALLTGTATSLQDFEEIRQLTPRVKPRPRGRSELVEAPAAPATGFEWLVGVTSRPIPPRKQPRHTATFFVDIFPAAPVAPSMATWYRQTVYPPRRRANYNRAFPPGPFIFTPQFSTVSYTPTRGAAGVPRTRNKLFWRLPDLGTLSLRTDRLTGDDNEARLQAPEGLQDDYTLVMPDGLPTASRSLKVGADGQLEYGAQTLTASVTWDPASINNNQQDTKTVTVAGAAVGDPAFAGFTTSIPSGMFLHASVTATDTVTVTLVNSFGGAAQDLASGTLTVAVVKQ